MGKGTEDVLKALRGVESASDEMGDSLLFHLRVLRWVLIIGFSAFFSMITFKECTKINVQHGFVRSK